MGILTRSLPLVIAQRSEMHAATQAAELNPLAISLHGGWI